MQPTKENDKDNLYMYKFRTNSCTKKRCRNPSKCFDAHSQVMRRRVPKLRHDGLFNYIPELCPQWQKSKKCHKGDSCHRSHGWLEIIFHPLLYKTKICKSNHKNGVCREYGVYCAKAHNPTEIRNLVKIYGDNWKRHYDLSLRETDAGYSTIAKSQSSKCSSEGFQKMQSDGNFFNECVMNYQNNLSTNYPEQTNGGENMKVSKKSTSFETVTTLANSPFFFASSPLFGSCGTICDIMADLSLDTDITSYTQLYTETVTMSEANNSALKFRDDHSDPEVSWDHTWHSPRNAEPQQKSSSSSSSNSYLMNPFDETWRISEPLDLDWTKRVEHS